MATGECLKVSDPSASTSSQAAEIHQMHARSLQQAVSCILSIHNAFTPAVYQRYRKEIYKLARGVSKRLSRILLGLLKAPAPGVLFLREPESDHIHSNLADIKMAYKTLITDFRYVDNENPEDIGDQQAEAFVRRLGTFLVEARSKPWSDDIANALA